MPLRQILFCFFVYNELNANQPFIDMSQVEKKDTTLSLKITSSLKAEIDETAKAEGKSINDFVYSAMLEYIKNYHSKQTGIDEIPCVEDARKILAERIDTLTNENLETAKQAIHNMLRAGEKSAIINLFDTDGWFSGEEDLISNEDKQIISSRINETLAKSGYTTYAFKHDGIYQQYRFEKFDIALSLDKDKLEPFIGADQPPPEQDDNFYDTPPF